jgi:hypothetical protein
MRIAAMPCQVVRLAQRLPSVAGGRGSPHAIIRFA